MARTPTTTAPAILPLPFAALEALVSAFARCLGFFDFFEWPIKDQFYSRTGGWGGNCGERDFCAHEKEQKNGVRGGRNTTVTQTQTGERPGFSLQQEQVALI